MKLTLGQKAKVVVGSLNEKEEEYMNQLSNALKYIKVLLSCSFIKLLIFCLITCIFIKSAIGAVEPAGSFPQYDLKINLSIREHNLEAVERVNFTNDTGVPLSELHFNIYANKQYTKKEINKIGFYENFFKVNMFPDGIKGADFKIKSVTNLDKPLAYTIEGPALTVMNVKLDKPLPPGEKLELEIGFALKLPHAFGILGYFKGISYLGHWYPVLSVYKGGKWYDNPLGVDHQPYFSDASYYNAELTIEDDQVVAHTGELVETQQNPNHTKTLKIKTDLVRDFTFASSSNYKVLSSEIKGIRINVYYIPTDSLCAQKALEYAISAMDFYIKSYGPYPYPVFNIAETHIGWLGNEFSNMIFIDSRGFNLPDILYRHLDFLISHEMAHQWWYLQVGNDQFRETWLDEAFATYANTLYLESKYGINNNYLVLPKWASFLPNTSFRDARRQRYLYAAKNNIDEAILTPINSFLRFESVFIYPSDKGMWGLDMLRHLVGEDVFWKIMRAYINDFRYKTADVNDFFRVCESISGKDLKWFFDEWLTKTYKCDYGLAKIKQRHESNGWNTSFTVMRNGEIRMPVEILIVTDKGREIWEKWDGQKLFCEYQIKTGDRVTKILVDPQQKLLDYRLQNNYWPAQKKLKLTPYYPMIYDIPTLNSPDAYSIVMGPTYNVFNAGFRISGRRIYDYMSYLDCRYDFTHRKVSALIGHQIEHAIGGLTSLGFEAGYDKAVDNAEKFNKGTDSLTKGRVSFTKQLGLTLYSVDKMLNDVTLYFERNREIYLKNQELNRSKLGVTYNVDTRILAWDPIKGSKLILNAEKSGKFLGSNTDFIKLDIDGRIYNRLWAEDHILANRLDIGLSHGDVAGTERYMLGGKDTLRGYGDEKFASKNKFLFNSEYRFPIIKEREDSFLKNFFTFNRLNGVVFFEAGLPWDKRSDIDLDNVKTDVGFGVRFEVTVLGFFEKTFNRLDVGIPLNGEGVPHIWFEITNAF